MRSHCAGAGLLEGDIAAGRILAEGQLPPPPAPGTTADYGGYLARVAGCASCHGADLAGRLPAEAEYGPPARPNITSVGALRNYNASSFIYTLRGGVRPNGLALRDDMPWSRIGQMSDGDLQAVWLYLQTLPR